MMDYQWFDLKLVIIILVFTVLFCSILQRYLLSRRLPRGPWGLPIVGHLHLLGNNPSETFIKLSKKYGAIFFIRLGKWPTLVLNDAKNIREALSNDAFADRPELFTFNSKGIVFGSYSQRFLDHRKILVNMLKTYAINKTDSTDELVHAEIDIMIQSWLVREHAPFDPKHDIEMSIGSILYQLLFGVHTDSRKDKQFLEMIQNFKILDEGFRVGNIINFLPCIRFLMPSNTRKHFKIRQGIIKFLLKKVEEFLRSYNKTHKQCITEGLIGAAEDYGTDQSPNKLLTKEQIYSSISEIIAAGFDTGVSSLLWAVLFLSSNVSIQGKLQDELDKNIGDRRLSSKEIAKLPYLNAVYLETLRCGSIVPLLLPHSALKNVKFQGFLIPKGSILLCNVEAVFTDGHLWARACEFFPERFLDENNRIISEKADLISLQFGVGRRRCPGDVLSRRNFCLIVSRIYRSFKTILRTGNVFEKDITLNVKPLTYNISALRRF